jgi:hypothetical protein
MANNRGHINDCGHTDTNNWGHITDCGHTDTDNWGHITDCGHTDTNYWGYTADCGHTLTNNWGHTEDCGQKCDILVPHASVSHMLLIPFNVVFGYLSNDLSHSELRSISTDVICCVWQEIPVITHQVSMQFSGALLISGKT